MIPRMKAKHQVSAQSARSTSNKVNATGIEIISLPNEDEDANALSDVVVPPLIRRIQRQLWGHANETAGQAAILFCDPSGKTYVAGTTALKGYLENWNANNMIFEPKPNSTDSDTAAGRNAVENAASKSDSSIKVIPPHPSPSNRKRKGKQVETSPLSSPLDLARDAKVKRRHAGEEMVSTSSAKKLRHQQKIQKSPLTSSVSVTSSTAAATATATPITTITSSAVTVQQNAPVNNVAMRYNLNLANCEAVDKFFIDKLKEMQQPACKIVAKAWFRVVLAKHQNQATFPFSCGEKRNPDWWPLAFRHKSIKDLTKTEHLQLLVAGLRSQLASIDELEESTNEVLAEMPLESAPMLAEIYQIAREETHYLSDPHNSHMFTISSPSHANHSIQKQPIQTALEKIVEQRPKLAFRPPRLIRCAKPTFKPNSRSIAGATRGAAVQGESIQHKRKSIQSENEPTPIIELSKNPVSEIGQNTMNYMPMQQQYSQITMVTPQSTMHINSTDGSYQFTHHVRPPPQTPTHPGLRAPVARMMSFSKGPSSSSSSSLSHCETQPTQINNQPSASSASEYHSNQYFYPVDPPDNGITNVCMFTQKNKSGDISRSDQKISSQFFAPSYQQQQQQPFQLHGMHTSVNSYQGIIDSYTALLQNDIMPLSDDIDYGSAMGFSYQNYGN